LEYGYRAIACCFSNLRFAINVRISPISDKKPWCHHEPRRVFQIFLIVLHTSRTTMSENVPPASAAVGTNGDVPGQPFYDKARAHLKDLLQKKRLLERNLAQQEESIYKKETDYLEDTPSGNIITGFEAYTKGSGSSAPGQRRRAAVQESNRVFSRSSISYNVNAVSWPLL
jgi:hypothetical protein